MNKHAAYAAWAPDDSIWSPWAKPVLFAHIWADATAAPPAFEIPSSFDPPPADQRTALILDLPGPAAVPLAAALAARGYRPVPLYNAVPAAPGHADHEVVPVTAIVHALQAAAPYLTTLSIPTNAPPAFLLDADRRTGVGPLSPGRLDNRSVSLPTDFPSAAFLVTHGIRQVWLVRPTTLAPQDDLAHTLRRYEQAGLPILSRPLAPKLPATPITITTPRWYRHAFQRFLATIGLRRNPLGGFGATLPDPSTG